MDTNTPELGQLDIDGMTDKDLEESLLIQRIPKGNHMISFDERQYKIGGEVITLKDNGFAYVCKAILGKSYNPKVPVSPTLLAVKIVAFARLIVKAREEAEAQAKQAKTKPTPAKK